MHPIIDALPDLPAISTASTRRCARPRSACSTAASSSATASTRWCRSTAAGCSASTSTWRGSTRSLGQAAHRQPASTAMAVAASAAAQLIAALPARRRDRPAGLHPGHARRRAARPRDAARTSTPTVFMMANPMKPPSAEQRHQGVACVTRARLPLGARRHQEHLAARQRAGAPDRRPTTARSRPSCSATAA